MVKEIDKSTWVNRGDGDVWLDSEVTPTQFNTAVWATKGVFSNLDSAYELALFVIGTHLGVEFSADELETLNLEAVDISKVMVEDTLVDPKRAAAEHPFPVKVWVSYDFEWITEVVKKDLVSPPAPLDATSMSSFPARHFDEIFEKLSSHLIDLEEYVKENHEVREAGTEQSVDFSKYPSEAERLLSTVRAHVEENSAVSFEKDSGDVIDVHYNSAYKIVTVAYRLDEFTKYAVEGAAEKDAFGVPQIKQPTIIKKGKKDFERKISKISTRATYYVLNYGFILPFDSKSILQNTQPTIDVYPKPKSALDFGEDEIPEDVMTASEKALEDAKINNREFLLSLALKKNAEKTIQTAVLSDLESALKDAADGNLTSKEVYSLLLNKVGMQTFVGLVLSCIAAKMPKLEMTDFLISAISQDLDISLSAQLHPIEFAKMIGETVSDLINNPLNKSTLPPQILTVWAEDLYLSTTDYMGHLAREIWQQFVALVKSILIDFILGVVKTILESCSAKEDDAGKSNINELLTQSNFQPSPGLIKDAPTEDFDDYLVLLNDFLSDLSAVLTPGEICNLLQGHPSDEVVQLALSILARQKYESLLPSPTAQSVIEFFVSIGKNISKDLCANVAETFDEIGDEEICNISDTFKIRKDILSGAGLSPEQIELEIDKHKARQLGLAKEVFDYANSTDNVLNKYTPEDPCAFFANIEIPSFDYAATLAVESSIDPVIAEFNSEFKEHISSIKTGREVYVEVGETAPLGKGDPKYDKAVANMGFLPFHEAAATQPEQMVGIGQEYSVGRIIHEHFSASIAVDQVPKLDKKLFRAYSTENHALIDQMGLTPEVLGADVDINLDDLTIDPYEISIAYPIYKAGQDNHTGTLEVVAGASGGYEVISISELTSTSASFESFDAKGCINNDLPPIWENTNHHLRAIVFAEASWKKLFDDTGLETTQKAAKDLKHHIAGTSYRSVFEDAYNKFRTVILRSVFWGTIGGAIERGADKDRLYAATGLKEPKAPVFQAQLIQGLTVEQPDLDPAKLEEFFEKVESTDLWDILYDLFMFDYTVQCPDGQNKKKHILDFEELKQKVLDGMCVIDEDSVKRALTNAVLLMLVRIYISEYLLHIIFATDQIDLRGDPTNYINYLVNFMRADIEGRFGIEFLEFIDGLFADYDLDTDDRPLNTIVDTDGTLLEVQGDSENSLYASVFADEWKAVFGMFYDEFGLGDPKIQKNLVKKYLAELIDEEDVALSVNIDNRFGTFTSSKFILERFALTPDGKVKHIDEEERITVQVDKGWKLGYRLSYLSREPSPEFTAVASQIGFDKRKDDRAYRLKGFIGDVATQTPHHLIPMTSVVLPYEGTDLTPREFLLTQRGGLLEKMSKGKVAAQLFEFMFDLSHITAHLVAVMHVDTLNSYSTRNSFALTKLGIKNAFDAIGSHGDPGKKSCAELPPFEMGNKFKLGCTDLEISFAFGIGLDLSPLCGDFDFAWKSKIAKLIKDAIKRLFRGIASIADPAVKLGQLLAAIACIKTGSADLCDIVYNKIHPFPLGFGPPITPIGAAYLGLECKFGGGKEDCKKEE